MWKFKGRSSKYTPASFSSSASAFYKCLEELENELDPKQIEKLIIFLEVIRTQEKFSKVGKIIKSGWPTHASAAWKLSKWLKKESFNTTNFNDRRYNICVLTVHKL